MPDEVAPAPLCQLPRPVAQPGFRQALREQLGGLAVQLRPAPVQDRAPKGSCVRGHDPAPCCCVLL
ncbi:hypothetical protein ACFQ0X_43440 [Streptomyces rectiviolaceus]|uniref:hypothetical protein n=1 Tax=Streptomyces rectiviolaceus TaxID=332591 RepID=UPI003641B4B7